MIVARHRRVDGVLLVALWAGACGGSKKIETGEACTLNSDCRNPLSCSFGKCHETCVATRDCPLGQSCVMTSAGGVCQLVEEADCRATGVCAAGLLCAVDYRCRSACQGGAGCSADQVCVGGVCAEPGDVDTAGNLPVKNPSPSAPGQGGGTDGGWTTSGRDASASSGDGGGADDCVIGPGGYCWSVWKSKTASSPASKVAWVSPPTLGSAHFTASSGIDSVAGAGIALRKGSAAVDLGKFDQIWFDADVPIGQPFDVSISTESTGPEPESSCGWILTGKGSTRYTVDLKSAHFCFPTACGFDRSGAAGVSFTTSGWGAVRTVDINVTGIGFAASNTANSPITTSGSPGQGLNGWCTSLVTWGNASASWITPPTTTSVQAQVTNLSSEGTGGPSFELPQGLRDLSKVTAIEFDADVTLGIDTEFGIDVNDMHSAQCGYLKVAAAGPRTYSVSLASPTICQTGEGHNFDRTNIHSIKIGSHWTEVGQSTFKITRLVLKGGAADAGAGTNRDAGMGGVVDAPASTVDASVAVIVDAGRVTAAPDAPTSTADAGATKPSRSVWFVNGQAQGAMSGFGWLALGRASTVSDPTCGATRAPFVGGTTCPDWINWPTKDSLCVSASIPALPGDAGQSDYDSNWGVQLGVNVADPDAALGRAYTGVAATFTGAGTNQVRIELHRLGDPDGTTYCALTTSGVMVPLTSFARDCWNTPPIGTKLTAADVSKIDKVGLQIASEQTPITISNFCLTGFTFQE